MTDWSAAGVDVGGTFTDVVLVDGGQVRVAKVPSTPGDQAAGILAGLGQADTDVAALRRFAHGTTVATNTVLEGDGARVVLVTTKGFRDVLEIARQDRPSLYDQFADRPAPVVPSDRVVGVDERLLADGSVLVELTSDEVTRVVERVTEMAPEAVAISLLHCYLDPTHEARLADALRVALPDTPVTVASELLPVFREYERTSTVALNAWVAPRMRRYLDSLRDRLRDAGLRVPVEVMRSGGGTCTAEVAAREPVHTLLSGPAAGAWGAAAVGSRAGEPDLLAFDMGGTSTDVTLIRDGRPSTSADGAIAGLPFAVGTTDIHTIGSGGGSVAWQDHGGALRVGPRSAGAVPGPAAYGLGGTEPTVTDANIVLGRLDPSVQLGGSMPLHADLAARAVQELGERLGLGLMETAAGIVRVVEAQMVAALRVVSVERGHDPRVLVLVPFGGAGALHQAGLAQELGCRRVLVPAHPGVLSALGLHGAPVTSVQTRTHLADVAEVDHADLTTWLSELDERARAELAAQGHDAAHVEATVDLRYRGQAFELAVPAGAPGSPRSVPELRRAFDGIHHQRYGYDQPEAPVEVVAVRVRAEAPRREVPVSAPPPAGDARGATLATRRLDVGGRQADVAVLDRSLLGRAARVDGPAVVTGIDATVWVAPWQRATVDDDGNLVLEERP